MKVTFPHMGNMDIVVKALLTGLGVDLVIPSKPSKNTISVGTRYSPETMCLPLKVNMGNYIEAFEKGADTIIMAGGVGPCRFGYYCEIQREILYEMGYDFDMIVAEPPRGHALELVKSLRKIMSGNSPLGIYRTLHFTWEKACAVDKIERMMTQVRPFESEKGIVTQKGKAILKEIDDASSQNQLNEVVNSGIKKLYELGEGQGKDIIKIGIVGEIYTILEPFINVDVERHLGEMGVYVERMVYISDWIKANILLDSIQNILPWNRRASIHHLAKPYLNHFVGGDGIDSIAHTVDYARKGYDGVLHLFPMTCMPEIVAKTILPSVSKDINMPVLSMVIDEHSSETGFLTRIEAFVDLIRRRKRIRDAKVISLPERRLEKISQAK